MRFLTLVDFTRETYLCHGLTASNSTPTSDTYRPEICPDTESSMHKIRIHNTRDTVHNVLDI
jgi:hypothetical protein